MRNSKSRNVIMLVAGGYLFYLGIKIIREGFIEGGMTGKSRVLGLIIAVFFLVFGVGIAIRSIRHLFMNGSNDQTEDMLEQADGAAAGEIPEETAAPETASAKEDGAGDAEDPEAEVREAYFAGNTAPEDIPEEAEEADAAAEAPARDLRWSYDNSASAENEETADK